MPAKFVHCGSIDSFVDYMCNYAKCNYQDKNSVQTSLFSTIFADSIVFFFFLSKRMLENIIVVEGRGGNKGVLISPKLCSRL